MLTLEQKNANEIKYMELFCSKIRYVLNALPTILYSTLKRFLYSPLNFTKSIFPRPWAQTAAFSQAAVNI